jgi:hypothetical protein
VHLHYFPLIQIKRDQLQRLKCGEGFYNKTLSQEQKHAVSMLLEHKLERSINALLAPPGTGKSSTLDEVIMQVVNFHLEDTPGSAL